VNVVIVSLDHDPSHLTLLSESVNPLGITTARPSLTVLSSRYYPTLDSRSYNSTLCTVLGSAQAWNSTVYHNWRPRMDESSSSSPLPFHFVVGLTVVTSESSTPHNHTHLHHTHLAHLLFVCGVRSNPWVESVNHTASPSPRRLTVAVTGPHRPLSTGASPWCHPVVSPGRQHAPCRRTPSPAIYYRDTATAGLILRIDPAAATAVVSTAAVPLPPPPSDQPHHSNPDLLNI